MAVNVKVEARVKGIFPSAMVTLILDEVPVPETVFSRDVAPLVDISIRHAKERCERLGYKKVLGVRFDGKQWEAKFEL